MAGPIAIDTPDYQRGVVNAQKLLAQVAPGVNNVTVGIPPNAETLTVMIFNSTPIQAVSVLGVSSGYLYAGRPAYPDASSTSGQMWFFDIASAVDAQVQVSISPGGTNNWLVYADSAPRLVVDATHPGGELINYAAFPNASGTFLAAATGPVRYRIFSAQMFPLNNAAVSGWLADHATGVPFIGGGPSCPGCLTYGPSGLPLSVGQPIDYVLNTGAGFMYCSITYTVGVV